MKSKFLSLILLFWLGLILSVANAQDNRTLETKVADVLALLPAQSNEEADRLYDQLIGLSDEGLSMVLARVVPNGKEEGVAPRFAVSLLTHHSSSKQDRARIEKAYLRALDNVPDLEVRAYLIDNLKIVGTNSSIKSLAEKIQEGRLAQQAIGALVSIGTKEAGAALVSALEQNKDAVAQARIIQALGELKYQPALRTITTHVTQGEELTRKQALWSLALLADAASYQTLLEQAKKVQFKSDPTEATYSFVEYIHQLSAKGNKDLVIRASQELLSNTLSPEQQHFRLAALEAIAQADPHESTKILMKEMNRFDPLYQKEVLKIAGITSKEAAAAKQWKKVFRKSDTNQAEILTMLAEVNRDDAFVEEFLLPALHSKNPAVRMAAAEQTAYNGNKKFQSHLTDYLFQASNENEIFAAKSALLRTMDAKDVQSLAAKVQGASPAIQVVILQMLAERRAAGAFDVAFSATASQDAAVRKAAYSALPNLASAENTNSLLDLLNRDLESEDVKQVQAALINSIDKSSVAQVNAAFGKNTAKVLPLLPYLNDSDALNKVATAFKSGSAEEKSAAFDALTNWQNHEAIRHLLSIHREKGLKEYHERAFQALVVQVAKSALPDDQKLLMFDAAMDEAHTTAEKTMVIRAVGNLRNFLALMFVSKYMDDGELNRAASRSVMQIALPTADARPGLTGSIVRNTLQKILDKLEGQDSQYEVIDIQTYLANMPYTKGFEPIFNGRDLSGWQGLVENPIVRSRMPKAELEKKQAEANAKLKESWSVKDGAIFFTGHGSNLCTIRPYGDFEMLVDWMISKNGDSGIYLRGSPQVQIWDPTGKEPAAKVGSGGLYNNEKHPSTPLTVADNPIGEWNTFHIKMVGERVTVHLNGVLVVDNVVMENYWDRSIPIFPEEAIELQAHGNELAFRNVYVKELGNKPYELTAEEKADGYELLFNGKDLENWLGNKTEYIVEDNAIAIYPSGEGHGNLYTGKEYSDFIFRFEFQLTPGANNGLGIHAPLNGDAAYGGKEIQILDNEAPVYAELEPYQYHGSVYGILPAKRGFLKPVGEWNQQEVYVNGDRIKVTLNGTVILDGDLKKATRNGAMDKKPHPGLQRHKGHIAFLGHGTVVRFRNIRIKELGGSY